ncbi:hypothetical protein ElyMa_004313400 [Elysia marginata]|uniref:Uncharacterized protein n=1 Tax=Elysia marginata TaxID=1093978 RepID=A0AAV4GY41_9GAST|nr:hypothetical protein ElyMa_004313400 [Elysia marginata]
MLWVRLVPMLLLASSLIYFVFLSSTGLLQRSTISKRHHSGVERHGLIPYSVLNRGHAMRDRELTRAREALEYWWSIRKDDRNGEAGSCPLSVSGPPKLSLDEDEPRQVFYQLQAISVMEALGFDNVTTCGGRYPRIIVDIQALREGKDNVYMTANYSTGVAADAPHLGISKVGTPSGVTTKQADEQISRKFCYTPTYRPFRTRSDDEKQAENGSETNTKLLNSTSSPHFCPQLLQLHRDIEAGKEPPLLTLFTWIPDPIHDPYRLSRHIMLMNLEMLRPFVQPVLVSDIRQIMAIAHGMGWPCLPIRQFSPDNLPIYKHIVEDVMSQFNSTFYGYARATSAFDSSLLETLLAVKQKFLSIRPIPQKTPDNTNYLQRNNELHKEGLQAGDGKAIHPPIIIYGSAMYKNNLQSVKTFQDLGVQAEQRGRTDWSDKEDSMVYFIHTKMDVSDLPNLKIEDKYLNPFLVTRSRMAGHVALDASRTLLCLLNNVVRRRPAWNRVDLPTKPRDQKYNPRLAVLYIRAHSQRVQGKNVTMYFDKGGDILFQGA